MIPGSPQSLRLKDPRDHERLPLAEEPGPDYARVRSARVAYIDNDQVVVAHARALLATDDLVSVISKDAREYGALLDGPKLGALIDLAKPVCVLFVSMLHFMPEAEADAAVAAFRERMAPGSYLVISTGVGDEQNASAREQVQAAYGTGTVLTGRPRTEITAYFGDFDLVPPGLVPVTEWPLDAPDGASLPMLRPLPSAPMKAGMLAGIGRKPG